MAELDYATIIKAVESMQKGGSTAQSGMNLGSKFPPEEVAAMTSQLSEAGRAAIAKAAQYAIAGDQDKAKTLIMALIQTPEGAQLLKKILASYRK